MKRLIQGIFFLCIFYLCSCTKDKLEVDFGECVGDITYENQVKDIINLTCAYAGCHIESNTVPGDFTSYDGLTPWLEANKFRRRVLELRDMPPLDATGPTDLSQEELDILNCWIENNYAEN